MTTGAPTYDLVMLLDPQAEDAARAKIVADAQAAIEAQGELLRHDEWGTRTLAYPINRKTAAEYHMLQFHASSADLLRQLDRSLRLADEAIRHRIIKLKPGVPDPPDMHSSADPLRATATATSPATATATPPAPAPATATPPPPATAAPPAPAPAATEPAPAATEPALPASAPAAEADVPDEASGEARPADATVEPAPAADDERAAGESAE